MAGRAVAFVIVLVALCAIGGLLWQVFSDRAFASRQRSQVVTEKAARIAHRQTLLGKVDNFIVSKEIDGEQSPMSLIEARAAVDAAPNDETLAYAFAHLEREWTYVSPKPGRSLRKF